MPKKQAKDLVTTADHEALGGATDDQERAALTPPERVTPTPGAAALEKRIEELETKLAAEQAKVAAASPAEMEVDPEAMVEADFPLSATGFAVRVNGVRYSGKKRVPRKVYDLVMSMLSLKNQIERERMADRGSQVLGSKLDPLDYGSRIAKRMQGRHVL